MTVVASPRGVRRAAGAVILVLVALTAGQAGSGKPAAQAGANRMVYAISDTHWAGYAVHARSYASVHATWVLPAVDCRVTPQGHAAAWAGLDGFPATNGFLEQAGTDSYCENGSAHYSGWTMFIAPLIVSAPPVTQSVTPGDVMGATVTNDGGGKFTATLLNYTDCWEVSHTYNTGGAGLSAEAIVEAPTLSSTGVAVPLADFSNGTFSHVTANGSALGSGDPASAIVMSNSSQSLATVTALTSAPATAVPGVGFQAIWQHAA